MYRNIQYNIQYTRVGNPCFEHAVRLTPAYDLVQLNAVLSGSVNPG